LESDKLIRSNTVQPNQIETISTFVMLIFCYRENIVFHSMHTVPVLDHGGAAARVFG
jgi:hypothetical protein